VAGRGSSHAPKPKLQPSHAAQAGDARRYLPTWEQLNRKAQEIALERGHYAGYPLPVEGFAMDVAPGFPVPALGNYLPRPDESKVHIGTEDTIREDQVLRRFWSKRLNTEVYIVWHGCTLEQSPAGGKPYLRPARIELVYEPWQRELAHLHRLSMLYDTLSVATADAWLLEAELKAMTRLAELVTPHQFKLYVLTGMFCEKSTRSGVAYFFRRLRPTIALKENLKGKMHTLCCLCLHPVSYYRETHAGGMVPTDDVIAHLLLSRADEHLFWKRSNQHAPWRLQAGI